MAITMLLLSLVIASGCANGSNAVPENVNWDFYNDLAVEFISATANGDFSIAVGMFSDVMTRGFGEDGLREAWNDIITLAGDFVGIYAIENGAADGYYISGVIMRHEKYGFAWNIVFSEEGLIYGLRSGGTIPLSGLTIQDDDPPMITEHDGFIDYPIVIGEGTDYPLNGILSIPANVTGKVPAVVLVHGSGPSDMSGVPAAMPGFASEPYRDIAEHLAANGIAVIRYDKRTFTHGLRLPQDFTVWEETIEDAILAAQMLKADLRIDENKVFIIGHSLGGMLAPRIHAEGGNFAGLILLAGSPRSLLEISRDQNIDYVNEHMDGEEKEEALATLTEEMWYTNVIAPIMSVSADEAKTSPTAFGVSIYYLQDMLNNPAENFIRDITKPFLILQGSADFQITVERDFELYRLMLADRANVTFIVYEGLNHLFITSTTGTIEEYELPGNVENIVLEDIVNWIKTQ